MPRYEITGVKVNIGLVVLTNISIFIFLIQVAELILYCQIYGSDHNNTALIKNIPLWY